MSRRSKYAILTWDQRMAALGVKTKKKIKVKTHERSVYRRTPQQRRSLSIDRFSIGFFRSAEKHKLSAVDRRNLKDLKAIIAVAEATL